MEASLTLCSARFLTREIPAVVCPTDDPMCYRGMSLLTTCHLRQLLVSWRPTTPSPRWQYFSVRAIRLCWESDFFHKASRVLDLDIPDGTDSEVATPMKILDLGPATSCGPALCRIGPSGKAHLAETTENLSSYCHFSMQVQIQGLFKSRGPAPCPFRSDAIRAKTLSIRNGPHPTSATEPIEEYRLLYPKRTCRASALRAVLAQKNLRVVFTAVNFDHFAR